MTRIHGVSFGFHDAALSVVENDKITYASHSERYSRIKNDPELNWVMVRDAINQYGAPDVIVYHENPFLKWTRQLYSGEKRTPILDHRKKIRKLYGKEHPCPIKTVGHHESHAAAGYYTSPFDEAAVIIVDAIGEWDTISVWKGEGKRLKKITSVRYPNSLGLLYSAFTKHIGLKPNEEEHSLMALAAYGEPVYFNLIYRNLLDYYGACTNMGNYHFSLKENLHIGLPDKFIEALTKLDVSPHFNDYYTHIATSVQRILEDCLMDLFFWVSRNLKTTNLVYGGGVALNCSANAVLARRGYFDKWWIMPNPGDAGSSLGAALAHRKDFVKWEGPYLGTNIDKYESYMLNNYNTWYDEAVETLLEDGVIAVAKGRAEFGPRALGNRSLLADPRRKDIKERLDTIKNRAPYRPYAPVILEEDAHEYFDMPFESSPYMQFAVPWKKPPRDGEEFRSVSHVDGTARVQTVNEKQNSRLYSLLKHWKCRTNCPMLLNTSLNTKGEPLVNTWADVENFYERHNVKVF